MEPYIRKRWSIVNKQNNINLILKNWNYLLLLFRGRSQKKNLSKIWAEYAIVEPMNKIICTYVNATPLLSNTKIVKSQFARQYTRVQTKKLKRILNEAAKRLNFTDLNDWYKLPTKVSMVLITYLYFQRNIPNFLKDHLIYHSKQILIALPYNFCLLYTLNTIGSLGN